MNSSMNDVRQLGLSQIYSGQRMQEWGAGSLEESSSRAFFSGHGVSPLTTPLQPLLSEQKQMQLRSFPADLQFIGDLEEIDLHEDKYEGASSISVQRGSLGSRAESTLSNFWHNFSGCFRCKRHETSISNDNGRFRAGFVDVTVEQPGADSAEDRLASGLAQVSLSDSPPDSFRSSAAGELRFKRLKKHLGLYPVDVEKFHHLTASALNGRQEIIKFQDFKGELPAIHNSLDPNIPNWHMTVIDGSDEYLRKELPPYFWSEFSISDARKQTLDLVALVNMGDPDCNYGIWGEIFMQAGKIKIANIQATGGDSGSEIYLTQAAPEFTNFDSSIFSNKVDKDVFFTDFSEIAETDQLSRLISVAIVCMHSSIEFYYPDGFARQPTLRRNRNRYCL